MADERKNRPRPRPTEPWLQPRKRLPPPWLSPAAQTAFLDQRAMEQEIRDILGTEKDIQLLEVVGYYNFARQAMKLIRKSGAKTPSNDDLAAIIRRWATQGMKEPIMVRILKELFKIDYPVGVEPVRKT
jgi:hypothetical protein